jgi:hypothetical protein
MATTLYPLHAPPKPWHTVGLDYLIYLHLGNGFDNVMIVVDHLTRMAHFLPCTESVTLVEENANLLVPFPCGRHHLLASGYDTLRLAE